MPNPDYFDFPTENLSGFDQDRFVAALRDHPAIFLNHLEIAAWLDGWIERLVERREDEDGDFVKALREVRAHLRQADFVPGGAILDEPW